MTYEHGGARYEVSVGLPRKRYDRRRGPRGGRIRRNLLAALVDAVLACGLFAAFGIEIPLVRQRHPEPSRRFRWRPGISSTAATLVMTAGGFAIADVGPGFYAGLATAISVFLVTGFATGLQGVPRIVSTAAGPGSVLARDRCAGVELGWWFRCGGGCDEVCRGCRRCWWRCRGG